MDKNHSITIEAERKRGQHLGAEERGAIQQLKKLGYSNRGIAREINCSPSTIGYELGRGTPAYTGRGRRPGYSAKRGAAVYKANRSCCRRPITVGRDSVFLRWVAEQVRSHKEKCDAAQRRLEEAKANMEREEATNRAAVTQVSNLMEWADLFDKANKETRHMILARLIDRVEVGAGYKVTVKFKITYEQFLGTAA